MLLRPENYIKQSEENRKRVVKADTVSIQDFTVCLVERIVEHPNPDKEGFGVLTEVRRFVFRTKAGSDFKKAISKWNKDKAVIEYKTKLAVRKAVNEKVEKYANIFGYNR